MSLPPRIGPWPTHVRRFPGGQRDALAFHCSLAHSGAWSGLAAALVDLVAITAFDLPGHGRSALWPEDPAGPDIHTVATDVGEALLGDGPRDLIGHSFGATVALRLAARHPSRVRSLTLIEPVFFAAALADTPEIVAAHDIHEDAFRAAMASGDKTAAARAFTRVWGDGRPWDSLGPEAQAALIDRIHIIPQGVPTLYQDAAGLMRPGVLARITAPVLLVEGGDTPAVMGAINTALGLRLPNSTRLIVPGAGHMVPISHPQDVAAGMRAMLAQAELGV